MSCQPKENSSQLLYQHCFIIWEQLRIEIQTMRFGESQARRTKQVLREQR